MGEQQQCLSELDSKLNQLTNAFSQVILNCATLPAHNDSLIFLTSFWAIPLCARASSSNVPWILLVKQASHINRRSHNFSVYSQIKLSSGPRLCRRKVVSRWLLMICNVLLSLRTRPQRERDWRAAPHNCTGEVTCSSLEFCSLVVGSVWNEPALKYSFQQGLNVEVLTELACRDDQVSLGSLNRPCYPP